MAKSDVPHKHIAPRLASGLSRVTQGNAFPPHIKYALQMIAVQRGESVSWVIEQIVYSFFGFKEPRFVGTRHAVEIDAHAHARIVKTTTEKKFQVVASQTQKSA
jgi:hypothetical protein